MPKMNLTKSAIAKIMPGERDLIAWDTAVKGLGLKVTPAGKKSFFVYYRTLDHIQRKPRIGSFPEISPDKARTIALDILGQVRSGGDPSADLKAKRMLRGTGTVAEYFAEYQSDNAHLRSLPEIKRIFERDILPTLGTLRTEEVTRGEVSRLLAALSKEGAPSTASNARKRLSAFYAWALPRLPDHASNPVTGAIRPKPPTSRDRVLSDLELSALWKVLENEAEPWRTALQLLALTGQRRGEVFEADWSEFDLEKAVWQIPGARTKNGKVHIVPLSPPVLKLLASGKQAGKLFPGGASGQRPFSRAARRIRAAVASELGAPVEAWSWHDIRRTVATGLQRLGIRQEVTEAVLNHVSGSRAGIVGVYQRYEWATEKRVALDAWGGALERIIAGDSKGASSNVVALRA